VVILGGTGKALAKAFNQVCHEQGFPTVILGSSMKNQRVENELHIQCDLTNPMSIDAAAERLELLAPEISGFIWVAGQMLKGSFAELSILDILDAVDINFRGGLPIAQVAWRKLLARKEESFFNSIASTSALRPRDNEQVYCASKSALAHFTRCLMLEEPPEGFLEVMPPIILGGLQSEGTKRLQPQIYKSALDPLKVARHIFALKDSGNYGTDDILIERGSL
jgi:NAD(P)-dependent dehydrogenase (short-subunit alcohol dehydrogenase family)